MSTKEKQQGKLKTFFFVIFIPIIFMLIIALIISSFLGFNMIEVSKNIGSKIPFISAYVQTDEPVDDKELILQLEENIATQQAEITNLESELESMETEIKELRNENSQLAERVEIEQELKSRKNDELKEIAKTYEAMSAKNAAAILMELSDEDAVSHLSFVSLEARAKILAKMDEKKAALIIEQLAK